MKKISLIITVLVVLAAMLLSVSSLFESLNADETMVVQSVGGDLSVYTDPGIHWQGFGRVTIYKKRSQYGFSTKSDQGRGGDESIGVTFNDGGHAQISGVISWEMPASTDLVLKIHSLFGAQNGIDQQLIRPAIERAVYLTGPLMSSTESFSSRRSEFLQLFEDQARYGIYRTETVSQKVDDAVTGRPKTVNIVRIVQKDGKPERQSQSPIAEFGIVLLPPAIDNINYDDAVKGQMKTQQEAVAQIQTAQAKAREAEQQAITVAKTGEAEAAKAKWIQEALKATEVTRAQQEKEVAELRAQQELQVATLQAQAAEQTKRKEILLGEGEAERKRLVMQADGALEKKLDAWLQAQTKFADAVANSRQPLVPSIVMGGTGAAGATNSVQDILSMYAVKSARDLSLDIAMGRGVVQPGANVENK